MAKNTGELIGKASFNIGVGLAILFGLLASWSIIPRINSAMAVILMLAGVLIGLLNVVSKESMSFMTACTILIIVTVLGRETLYTVPEAGSVMNALLLVFVPATIMVAMRNIFEVARN